MKKLSILIGLGAVLIPMLVFADSAVTPPAFPRLINYQGMLTDAGGTPIDGTRDLTFRIYDDTTGGGALQWSETQSGVDVDNGLFNVVLGKSTALDLAFDKSYWLEVEVGGEVMPRIRMTSVGYAYRAWVADSAVVAVSASAGGGWIDEGTTVRLETATDKVGIGTATPNAELEVSSTDEVDVLLNRSSKSVAAFLGFMRDGSLDWAIHTPSGDTSLLIINQNFATVQSFLQNGNVGFGTSSPSTELEVSSTDKVDLSLNRGGKSWEAMLDFKRAGIRDWGILTPSGDTSLLIINQNSATVQSFLQNGNVGIGTASPSSETKVHIQAVSDDFGVLVDAAGTSGSEIGLHTSTGKWASLVKNAYYSGCWQRFDESSGAFIQEIVPGGDARFKVAGSGSGSISWTEALTIKTSGNVGIGTTEPSEKLDVNGTARLRGIEDQMGGDLTDVVINDDGVLYKKVEFSSRKYKQNIRNLDVDLDEVLKLQSVRFEWKKTGTEDVGLIAEDVQQAIPDLVRYNSDGSPEGVRYDKLALFLLEALKAQQERISALEQEIAGLKR